MQFATDARLRALMDTMLDPFAVYSAVRDEDGRIVDFIFIDANPAACAYNGLTRDQLVGAGLLELFPNQAAALPMYVHAVESGEPLFIDGYSYTHDLHGKDRHYDVRGSVDGDTLLLTWRDVTAYHRESEAVAESEERFRMAMDHSPTGMSLVSPDGRYLRANPIVCEFLGRDEQELLGCTWQELTHPDDVATDAALVDEVERGLRDAYRMDKRYLRPDGTVVWADLSVACVRNADGSIRYFISQLLDVTERIQAQHALAEAESRYRLLAENTMDIVFLGDTTTLIEWVSPSVTAVLGYAPEELIGQDARMLFHPDDAFEVPPVAEQANRGKSVTFRARYLTKAGAELWVEMTVRPILDEATGAPIGRVVAVRDVHEEVMVQSALDREVDFDALTGLAKRGIAVGRIKDVLAARSTSGWALLCAGIDGLSAVNQALGHSAGDVVLQTVADRLVAAAGARDRVARIAGDEFAVLLPGVVTADDAAHAAERIRAAVAGPVHTDGHELHVTVCIGIATPEGPDPDELLRDATTAMREAARKGPDRWEFFDPDVTAAARQGLRLQAELREALKQGQVEAWLQPIVTLSDSRVIGYEALARWVHDDGSVTMPDEFLVGAERAGLLVAIDLCVLRKALHVLATLPPSQHMAVNLSAQSLADPSLVETVRAELARSQVEPTRLHLEVTETNLLHVTDEVTRAMEALAATGVSWWVDDFGVGFSSIQHLRDLPVSGIKLDRSFTSAMATSDQRSTRLAHGLAGLAQGLGMGTVAEGVERVDQVAALLDQGWLYGQGHLFGAASPPADRDH